METIVIIKLLSLFVALWFWTANIINGVRGNKVPAFTLAVASAAAVIFIYLQWGL
jgi:hypothetical protein